METVLLAALLFAIAIFAPRVLRQRFPDANWSMIWAARLVLGIWAAWLILSTSIVQIPANEVGLVRKLFGTKNLPESRLIATNGETGYQAELIPPGTFRITPFFHILNRLETKPLVVVPNGFYGRIVARDGASLRADQIMADAWPESDFSKYLDAEYFLTHGGQKGLQLSILKPGTYALNLALFEIKIGFIQNSKDIVASHDDVYDLAGLHREESPLDTSITKVPAGFVGVVRSSVQMPGIDCAAIIAKTDEGGLTAELVPRNCKGIWAVSLPPNDYYLNKDAYDVTLFPTRVITLDFKGGFTRRYIDLKVDAKGDFTQTERSVSFPKPNDAADQAVNTKVEGWEIPQELRAVLQVAPETAPIVVAAVGNLENVETRIVVPSIRSHVRNVFGGNLTVPEADEKGNIVAKTRQTRVLDTIEQRPSLEEAILKLVQIDGRRGGVGLKEIRLGESAIPPELLLARQREQLATQLKRAYIQEKDAQVQRQDTEQARATADQQRELVKAQIDLQKARLNQEKRSADGHAERLFLEEQAAGQTAQANVLGKDSVLRLQQLKIVTELLAEHPELLQNIKLPQTLVTGSTSPLDSAAAIFGSITAGSDKR